MKNRQFKVSKGANGDHFVPSKLRDDVDADVLTELKEATPHLIARAESSDLDQDGFTMHINQGDPGWDEILYEDYDLDGYFDFGPVYRCLVRRGTEFLLLHTFWVPREVVNLGWGDDGAAFCDPSTGVAIVRFEFVLHKRYLH